MLRFMLWKKPTRSGAKKSCQPLDKLTLNSVPTRERRLRDRPKTQPKTRIKAPDSLRREASQAAGAAPTLRYGPAGDSAPRLRLGVLYGRKLAFGVPPKT